MSSMTATRRSRLPRPAIVISKRLTAFAAALALLMTLALGALAAEQGKPKEGKEGAVEGPVFVKMSPITLPIVQGNKITKTVGLVLALEL